MQVVVIKSPKCLRGILRRLFGIKNRQNKTLCAAAQRVLRFPYSLVV